MRDIPIFLTGFMGTGKSEIGRLLARRLGRIFLDTDEMIERRAGKTIPQIFAEEGEEAFRRIERECVAQAASRKDAVVSLGGGAVTQPANLEVVRQRGILICIEADVDTILERVSRRENRPLLAGLSREEKRAKIERMLADRRVFYDRADLKIRSSDARSPAATAEALLEMLEQWCAERTGRS